MCWQNAVICLKHLSDIFSLIFTTQRCSPGDCGGEGIWDREGGGCPGGARLPLGHGTSRRLLCHPGVTHNQTQRHRELLSRGPTPCALPAASGDPTSSRSTVGRIEATALGNRWQLCCQMSESYSKGMRFALPESLPGRVSHHGARVWVNVK